MTSEIKQFVNVNRRLDEMSRQQGDLFKFLVDLSSNVDRQMRELNKKQEEAFCKISNQQQQMSNAQKKLEDDIRTWLSRENSTPDSCIEYQETVHKQLTQIVDVLDRLSDDIQSLADNQERFQSKPKTPNQETESPLKDDDLNTREFTSSREGQPSTNINAELGNLSVTDCTAKGDITQTDNSKIKHGDKLINKTKHVENYIIVAGEKSSDVTTGAADLPADQHQKAENKIIVLGGNESCGVIESYSAESNTWTLEDISGGPVGKTLAVTVGDVNLVIIEVDNKRTRSLDLSSKRWTELDSPPEYRKGMSAAADGNLVYLTGGYRQWTRCDVYDFHSNQWSEGPKLNVGRRYHGSATLSGKIYCCGGKDEESEKMASTEVFDPRKMEGKGGWTSVEDMEEERYKFGLASCSRFLWAVGGGRGWLSIPDFERYYPVNDIWTSMADMRVGRCGLSVCFFSGKLYAIGGKRDEDFVKTDDFEKKWRTQVALLHDLPTLDPDNDCVEAYDLEKKRWTQVAPLDQDRSFHASCVVQFPSH